MHDLRITTRSIFLYDYGFTSGLKLIFVAIVLFFCFLADEMTYVYSPLLTIGITLGVIGIIICWIRYIYLSPVCRDTAIVEAIVKQIRYHILTQCGSITYEYKFGNYTYTKKCHFTSLAMSKKYKTGQKVKMVLNSNLPDRALPESIYFAR